MNILAVGFFVFVFVFDRLQNDYGSTFDLFKGHDTMNFCGVCFLFQCQLLLWPYIV